MDWTFLNLGGSGLYSMREYVFGYKEEVIFEIL